MAPRVYKAAEIRDSVRYSLRTAKRDNARNIDISKVNNKEEFLRAVGLRMKRLPYICDMGGEAKRNRINIPSGVRIRECSVVIPGTNCPVCGKTFKCTSDVDLHLRWLHGKNTNVVSKVSDDGALDEKRDIFDEKLRRVNFLHKLYRQFSKRLFKRRRHDLRLVIRIGDEVMSQITVKRKHLKGFAIDINPMACFDVGNAIGGMKDDYQIGSKSAREDEADKPSNARSPVWGCPSFSDQFSGGAHANLDENMNVKENLLQSSSDETMNRYKARTFVHAPFIDSRIQYGGTMPERAQDIRYFAPSHKFAQNCPLSQEPNVQSPNWCNDVRPGVERDIGPVACYDTREQSNEVRFFGRTNVVGEKCRYDDRYGASEKVIGSRVASKTHDTSSEFQSLAAASTIQANDQYDRWHHTTEKDTGSLARTVRAGVGELLPPARSSIIQSEDRYGGACCGEKRDIDCRTTSNGSQDADDSRLLDPVVIHQTDAPRYGGTYGRRTKDISSPPLKGIDKDANGFEFHGQMSSIQAREQYGDALTSRRPDTRTLDVNELDQTVPETQHHVYRSSNQSSKRFCDSRSLTAVEHECFVEEDARNVAKNTQPLDHASTGRINSRHDSTDRERERDIGSCDTTNTYKVTRETVTFARTTFAEPGDRHGRTYERGRDIGSFTVGGLHKGTKKAQPLVRISAVHAANHNDAALSRCDRERSVPSTATNGVRKDAANKENEYRQKEWSTVNESLDIIDHWLRENSREFESYDVARALPGDKKRKKNDSSYCEGAPGSTEMLDDARSQAQNDYRRSRMESPSSEKRTVSDPEVMEVLRIVRRKSSHDDGEINHESPNRAEQQMLILDAISEMINMEANGLYDVTSPSSMGYQSEDDVLCEAVVRCDLDKDDVSTKDSPLKKRTTVGAQTIVKRQNSFHKGETEILTLNQNITNTRSTSNPVLLSCQSEIRQTTGMNVGRRNAPKLIDLVDDSD